MKTLSTRERDLEDAAAVLAALAARIDRIFIDEEIANLVREIADFDVGGRYRHLWNDVVPPYLPPG